MKVKGTQEAWAKVDVIFPTDYVKDDRRSERAGYDVYYSTAADTHAWISDLGDRLEVNLPDGSTVTIWIETEPQFSEYQLADALAVIDETIYQIDDKIGDKLQKATGLDEARKTIYSAYAKIAEILKAQRPDSALYKQYNLQNA